MVLSKLNDKLTYEEFADVNKTDIGVESSIYEIQLFDKSAVITIGTAIYTHASSGVIFFYIYLINNENKIDSCIGLYEINKNDILKIYDNEHDVDITKLGEPLLFSTTEDYINDSVNTDIKNYLHKWEKPTTNPDPIKPARAVSNVRDENTDDDVFVLGDIKTEKNVREYDEPEHRDDDLFKDDPNGNNVKPVVLIEESENDALLIKRGYTTTQSCNWIQKFMKNINYNIHDVKINSDSIFSVICDAYSQIGKITSVAKLRAKLADNITDKQFTEYRDAYLMISGTIKKNKNEIKRIKTKVSPELKRKANAADKTNNKPELEKIIEGGKLIKTKYDKLVSENRELVKLLKETVGDLADIGSIDRFKRFIQTAEFNPDTLAISLMEELLNIKFIILSEQSYIDNDLANVLLCNIRSNVKSPEYYIIVSVMKNRYSLVSYKNKKMLEFFEVPYYIKTLVVNKCMERNSGDFFNIEDFKNFKTRIGVHVNSGEPVQDAPNELYDPNTVFMFYERSSGDPYPGKGSGENIVDTDVKDFVELSTKPFYDWRKKLDDSWKKSPIYINGKTYTSVSHYYNGSKFKHGFPDFFEKFSVESDSDISKDVNLAKIAGNLDGRLRKNKKSKKIRPEHITIDPEFYPHNAKIVREEALRAKFTQHIDLSAILKHTNNAKLTRYSINQPVYIDLPLMKIRQEII
jgi:predicted NAD-dependent protein-ADP-ribosyltransferase YbiA (DUF1768 family)